jgi:hypothetical protein
VAPEAPGRIIDLGPGELTTIRDLISVIEDVVVRPGATVVCRPPVTRLALTCTKRRARTGSAKTPLREGIERRRLYRARLAGRRSVMEVIGAKRPKELREDR